MGTYALEGNYIVARAGLNQGRIRVPKSFHIGYDEHGTMLVGQLFDVFLTSDSIAISKNTSNFFSVGHTNLTESFNALQQLREEIQFVEKLMYYS